MAELDLGLVKGDPFTYADFTSEQLQALKGDKGDPGVTPTIKAGTATSLDATATPTVTATTVGTTTTFDFGIPKGDISALETPTFDDTTSTYSTLTAANTAAETSSNAIKSKTSIFTTLSNMKKSFSAIVQGLKILGTNVGAITGITSDLAGESETVAASIKCVNQLNSSLSYKIGDVFSIQWFVINGAVNMGASVCEAFIILNRPITANSVSISGGNIFWIRSNGEQITDVPIENCSASIYSKENGVIYIAVSTSGLGFSEKTYLCSCAISLGSLQITFS